jgi:hypothetical protein
VPKVVVRRRRDTFLELKDKRSEATRCILTLGTLGTLNTSLNLNKMIKPFES